MYQALYRKWRPQTFEQVVGQKHITETLKNQVKTGRLSHAYIFIGTRGTGKTTCARILAKAVNCENPVDGNPCGKCQSCLGISQGRVMDVVELDAASNNGVDNVRALREEAVFSPSEVKKRVYIIDEVHMLSTPAFNALLKILEEPPEHLMFILATTELQKVPATILSRCQRHSFRRVDTEEIARYLEHISQYEQFDIQHEAAELIARLAEGGVRDALSLLDQCSGSGKIDVEAVYSAMGLAGKLRIAALLDNILDGDTQKTLEGFSSLWMDGKDPATLLGELSGLMRDVLMVHVAPKAALELISGSYTRAMLDAYARRMTTEELICAMGSIQSAISGLRDVKNPKAAAELCLISLCEGLMGDSLKELRARVSRLEEKLKGASAIRPEQEAEEEAYMELARSRPERRYEDEEPEDDMERFVEEQPEDAFIQRQDKKLPVDEIAPVQEPTAQTAAESPPSDDGGELWREICKKVSDQLPMDIKVSLGDENRVHGRIEASTLYIEVLPGFLHTRFNRQEVLGKFTQAAAQVTGRDVRVQLCQLQAQERPQRDLEELKKFKEVRFI